METKAQTQVVLTPEELRVQGLHFGYGSNMSRAKLWSNLIGKHWGGTQNHTDYDKLDDGIVGSAAGFEFCTRPNGTANIAHTKTDADVVWGVLYKLTPEQFDRIWDAEGRKSATLIPVEVTLQDGSTVNASTWVFYSEVNGKRVASNGADRKDDADVRKYYMELIVEAARSRNGIPAQYIEDTLIPIMTGRGRQ